MPEISEELQALLWQYVKDRRDALLAVKIDLEETEALLCRMQNERMDAHLPTAEDVRGTLCR